MLMRVKLSFKKSEGDFISLHINLNISIEIESGILLALGSFFVLHDHWFLEVIEEDVFVHLKNNYNYE